METFVLNTPDTRSFPIKVNDFGHDYCVVYFHGLFGSSTPAHQYPLCLIKDLCKNEIDNCCFDFYAHGERKNVEKISDLTIKQYMAEIEMVLLTLKSHGYKKFILIGASFGGLLTHILKSIKLDCIGLIYFFSFFDLKALSMFDYNTIKQCIKNNQPLYIESQSGRTKEYLNVEFLKELEFYYDNNNIKDCSYEEYSIPKLVINGTYDTIADYNSAVNYVQKFKNAKLLIYDMQHEGKDKDYHWSEKNVTLLNNKMIEFIKVVTTSMNYFNDK